jgi:hypothetical protein
MTAPIFHFDNYVVRPITERDRGYLGDLIAGDPHHADCMDADFFLKLRPGEDAWAMEDERGKVLFYFKTQTAVRLSMQFAEAEDSAAKTRNRIALLKGLAWIEAQLRANSFREILFQTDGPELAKMAIRRMGFRESTELRRDIGVPAGDQKAHTGDWGTSPQVSQEGGG